METVEPIDDRSNGTAVAGKAYFETNTKMFIVYNGTSWIELHSDVAGPPLSNDYSVDLDGTDDYVAVEASSDFSFGTFDFSFSAWFKPEEVSGYRAVIDFRQQDGDLLPSLYYSTTSGYKLYVWTGSGQVANYNTTLTAGQWYHVVYTRSGTTGTIYLNGASVATGTDSSNYSMNGQPHIGGKAPGVSASYHSGPIDEVSVFSSALSASDIFDMYNSGTPTDISSLSPIGWWRMGDNDGGTGTTITDQGSRGNNGTLINGAAFSTDVPKFKNTYSLSFDGVDDYATSNFTPATSSGATISFWIKMPSLSINSAPYCSGPGTDAALGSLSLLLHKTLGYYVQVGNGTDSSLHHSSNGFGSGATVSNNSSLGYITDNLWHHVAVTIDGTSLKLYIDGGDASITASRTSNTQGMPYLTATSSIAYTGGIGSVTKIGQGNTIYYPQTAACNMDEIAYFETALSGSQVSSIYNEPKNISTLSPAVWWRMGDNEGGTGTTITDQGSAGQNLTTHNNPIFSTDVPSVSSPTYTNAYSLEFNGSSDRGDSSTNFGNSQMSVSIWMKFPYIKDNEYILWSPYYQLTMRTSGPRLMYQGYDQIVPGQAYSSITPDVDTWNHLVTTSDGTTHKLYWNGSYLGQRTNGIAMQAATSFRIGVSSNTAVANHYVGKLDELAVWNSVLSESDITSIYNNGIANDITSLDPLYWYRMGDNDNGSAPISDTQGNGSDIILTGTTFSTDTSSVSSPTYINTHSLELDGVNDYIKTNSNFKSTFQSNFSVSVWFKLNNTSGTQFLFSGSNGESGYTERVEMFAQSGNVRIFMASNGTQTATIGDTSGTVLTNWTHAVATYEQSGSDVIKTLYVNGVQQATSITSNMILSEFGSVNNPVDIFIGARNEYQNDSQYAGASLYTNGKINDVTIIPSTLSASDVAAIYNSGSPGDISSYSPVAWYRMNGAENNVVDQGSAETIPTVIGDPVFSTDIPT